MVTSYVYRHTDQTLQPRRAVFDPFVLAGLRPNDALVGLPPLPDTPRHQSTASSASQGVVTAFFNRTMRNESVHPKSSHSRTGSRDRLIDVERWAVPPTATTTISRSNSQKNLSSPTKYPVLSTRQSSTAVPRQPTQIRQSPTKTASTRPSPTRSVNRDTISHSHAPSTRSVHRSRSLRNSSPPLVASASFQLPTSTSDASLIGDCSFAGAPSSSNGDDSIDLGIRDVRPALPAPSQLGYQRGEVEEGSTTPTKALVGVQGKEHSTVSRGSRSTLKPSRPMQNLNESNLLPSSPAKFADLLTSTNALARTEPPWSGSESTTTARAGITATSRATPARESPARRQDHAKNPTVSPNKRSTVAPRIPRQSPSTATMSSVKSKRTFPASSSGNSLASVGEEAGHLTNPDMSTLLPVSSAERVRHLLRDDGMILRETMFDEPSFRSPVKAVRATPSYNDMETKSIPDAGDVTFDVRDLMAKMNKPKRASGTEESFVDLLHGDGDL